MSWDQSRDTARRDAADPDDDGQRTGDARRGRRRAADPARPLRRGRHRAGTARARGRAVRRRRRRRVRALHGQGPVQEGDARQRHPGRASTSRCGSATRSRTRSATRSSSSRRASARRSGSRRCTTSPSSRPPSSSRAGTTRRCSSRSSSRAWRSSAACSATGCRRRSRRCPDASTRSSTSGTTTRRSTTRTAWSSSFLPELPQETIERVQQLSVDAFVASECEGMARVDFFVREGGEVVVNELNTIPGLHRDERLREALRSVGHPVPGAARPPRRPRARAPRAPLEAQVLANPPERARRAPRAPGAARRARRAAAGGTRAAR